MKLLLDQNLSDQIPAQVSRSFPGSVHVKIQELDRASDEVVWERLGCFSSTSFHFLLNKIVVRLFMNKPACSTFQREVPPISPLADQPIPG